MLAALLYLQPGDTLNDQASPVKLYLVDGTYELFRSYFGPPGRNATAAAHSSGILAASGMYLDSHSR